MEEREKMKEFMELKTKYYFNDIRKYKKNLL
jgi:hypothetical protein